MPSTDRIHELLPWYVTGRLEPEEAERFRAHLPECDRCRDEMDLLRKLEAALEREGPELLEDHPTAERLVAAERGELDREEAAAVLRHVALCASCAAESAWIRGDAVAAVARSRPASGRPWVWLAAAAVLLIALLTVPLTLRSGSLTGIARPAAVSPIVRAEGPETLVAFGPDERVTELMLPVDFEDEAFPLQLEITDADGGTVFGPRAVSADLLVDSYLFVRCDRGDFRPGRYTAVLRSDRGREADQRFGFRVVHR